jgi:hypothetical protein
MKKVKAKVIQYDRMYHGIYCGLATVQIIDTKEILSLKTLINHKVGEIIEIYEHEDSGT